MAWIRRHVQTTAKLTTSFAGINNDLIYSAKATSTVGGNAISVAHVVAGNNTALSVSVTGNAITVNVATDGAGAPTSTAAQVKAAVEASGPAAALVTVAHAPGNNGTGVVAAAGAAFLSGGKTGAYAQAGPWKIVRNPFNR